MRVKKVKNLGSPVFMEISPKSYFDARSSLMRSFWLNFDTQGVIFGVKGQFYGVLRAKKVKKSRFSDFPENFTSIVF